MVTLFISILFSVLQLHGSDALTVSQYEKVNVASSVWVSSDSTLGARYFKFLPFQRINDEISMRTFVL
jgi:hypothetical protein